MSYLVEIGSEARAGAAGQTRGGHDGRQGGRSVAMTLCDQAMGRDEASAGNWGDNNACGDS
jgi:hypothetical protein